jgi:sn-glycerol 3-phosphate transport system ATP-binding protein
MVAGLETITSGTCSISGRVVNEVEPADRDIAMVFQNYALYPHMSVYDNMAYGLRNRKTPEDEIDRRVQEAAKILAIGDFLQRRPRQLSGGQRQRVAMGRAIVRKPQVFLFDEPLSNLDAKLRVQMRVEIKKLQRALGVTSIYVTHDQVEAMTLSDQLVVMNGGRIEQVGLPTDIYRRPKTTFVAGFIGSPPMNMMNGVAGVGAVTVGDMKIPVRDLPATVAEGRKVTVGLRPEDIIAADARDRSHVITVDFVEELGATRLLHGMFAEQRIVVQVQAAQGFVGDKSIGFSIDPAAVHVFDTESGERLN